MNKFLLILSIYFCFNVELKCQIVSSDSANNRVRSSFNSNGDIIDYCSQSDLEKSTYFAFSLAQKLNFGKIEQKDVNINLLKDAVESIYPLKNFRKDPFIEHDYRSNDTFLNIQGSNLELSVNEHSQYYEGYKIWLEVKKLPNSLFSVKFYIEGCATENLRGSECQDLSKNGFFKDLLEPMCRRIEQKMLSMITP